MVSRICQCPKHKNSVNKVTRQSQIIWNRFCMCAKRCPGIKTTETGERTRDYKYIEESKYGKKSFTFHCT